MWFVNGKKKRLLSADQFAERFLRHFLDGLLQITQREDGGAVAAGQVVPCHGYEVVLPPLQVQHQNVFNLFRARVEFGRRGAVYEYLELNVHRSSWNEMNRTFGLWMSLQHPHRKKKKSCSASQTNHLFIQLLSVNCCPIEAELKQGLIHSSDCDKQLILKELVVELISF